MRVKYEFEEEDFESCGQLLVLNRESAANITVMYKVGYTAEENRAILLISLSDGRAQKFTSKAALCDYLNEHREGLRPVKPDEAMLIADHGNRFKAAKG